MVAFCAFVRYPHVDVLALPDWLGFSCILRGPEAFWSGHSVVVQCCCCIDSIAIVSTIIIMAGSDLMETRVL